MKYNIMTDTKNMIDKINWFNLGFTEKLIISHNHVLFPEKFDKNSQDFLRTFLEFIITKVEGLTDDEIDKLFN